MENGRSRLHDLFPSGHLLYVLVSTDAIHSGNLPHPRLKLLRILGVRTLHTLLPTSGLARGCGVDERFFES